MKKNSIWWRLTPVAFWLTAANILLLKILESRNWEPSEFINLPLVIVVYSPGLYLATEVTVYCSYALLVLAIAGILVSTRTRKAHSLTCTWGRASTST